MASFHLDADGLDGVLVARARPDPIDPDASPTEILPRPVRPPRPAVEPATTLVAPRARWWPLGLVAAVVVVSAAWWFAGSPRAPVEAAAPVAMVAPAPAPAPGPATPPSAPTPLPAPLVVPFSFQDVVAPPFEAPAWAAGCGRLVVTGHTCDRGDPAANELIGRARAEHVRDRLVAAGVPADRIELRSAGASEPSQPNTTRDGRRANRRVTVACAAPGGAEEPR